MVGAIYINYYYIINYIILFNNINYFINYNSTPENLIIQTISGICVYVFDVLSDNFYAFLSLYFIEVLAREEKMTTDK